MHPYDMDAYDVNILEEFVKHPKCIAIGECGLDYFRLPDNEEEIIAYKAKQKEVFVAQIEFAIKYDKPLIVHIRDASKDSLDILIQYNNTKLKGVLHCFNADEQLLKLSKNFYYGIGGVLTFKNAKKLVNVLPKIPLDRIVIETDAPYLTPHPFRGQRNEPKYCVEVVQKISELLDIAQDEVENISTNNAKSLFKEFTSIN